MISEIIVRLVIVNDIHYENSSSGERNLKKGMKNMKRINLIVGAAAIAVAVRRVRGRECLSSHVGIDGRCRDGRNR